MSILNNIRNRTRPVICAAAVVSCTGSMDAATTFVTTTSGNAAALQGVESGVTALTLSAGDGGGTINLNTIDVIRDDGADNSLGMDADSMGVGNDKWGSTNQRWLFSFDQTVSFDAIGFFESNGNTNTMIMESVAWKSDATASGSNWSFVSNGTVGTFTFVARDGPSFDFSGAGVSNVAANTQIKIAHSIGGGGASMSSFTITPIPEPSALTLIGLGCLGLAFRRRR